MTLKNLSISIEKLTHILRCKIALLLRCAICILIFSICILWVQNNVFAQEFEPLSDSNKYPTVSSGESIPLSLDDAVLLWSYTPAQSTVGKPFVVVDASIVKGFNARINKYNLSSYGYTYIDNDADVRYWASVVSPSSFYSPSTTLLPPLFAEQIQDLLEKKKLGTVESRKNFIYWINHNITTFVTPFDFRSYIQPWIIVGLVIAILIPAWYLCRRFLRG